MLLDCAGVAEQFVPITIAAPILHSTVLGGNASATGTLETTGPDTTCQSLQTQHLLQKKGPVMD